MFSSQILDVAIGLVFLYFFLSLLCSVIIEIATALTKKRPRMLKEGLRALLQDDNVLNILYKQPLFMGNTTPKTIVGSLGESIKALVPARWKQRVPIPSYISSRSFVLSLLESLKQYPEVIKNLAFPENDSQIQVIRAKSSALPGNSKVKEKLDELLKDSDDKNALASILTWDIRAWYDEVVKTNPEISQELLMVFEDFFPVKDYREKVTELVAALPSGNAIRGALMPLLETAGKGNEALDKALERMEKWYDEAMDRVTGWYKRYSQTFALILALLVALALNADTFAIGKALYRDPALRKSMVDMAVEEVKKGNHTADQGKTDKGKPEDQHTSPSKPGKVGKAKGSSPTHAKQSSKGGAQEAAKPLTPGAPRKLPAGQPEMAKKSAAVGTGQVAQSGEKPAEMGSSDSKLDKDIERIKTMNAGIKNMEALNLPLGWGPWWGQWWGKNKKDLDDPEKNIFKKYLGLACTFWQDFPGFSLASFLGILFTAFMVSLGSNFWFELLNKLVNMRNAGKKPLTKEEQEAKNQ
jgi:hypothetical protein